MVGLGPKTLCCGKPYTACVCEKAVLGDTAFELPEIAPRPKFDGKPKLYPGTPASWRPYQPDPKDVDIHEMCRAAVMTGGFTIITEWDDPC